MLSMNQPTALCVNLFAMNRKKCEKVPVKQPIGQFVVNYFVVFV